MKHLIGIEKTPDCSRSSNFRAGSAGSSAIILFLAAIFALAFLAACGSSGGSGGGTVTALTLPGRITLSSAEGSSNSAMLLSMRALRGYSSFTGAFNDADTDYENQTKDTWIDDTDALDMVNDILGVVQDTGYEHFLNAGPYKALVRKVDDSEQSQGGSTTTSTTVESLMEIIVDVTRTSNSAPMIVKVWVKEENGPGGGAMLIRGYFTVTAGVSVAYPYGQMTAHFKGIGLNSDGSEKPGDPLFTMAMSVSANDAGNVVVEFADAGEEDFGGGIYEWDNRVRIVASADLSQGNAYVYEYEADPGFGPPVEETFYFTYNDDYFKYQEVGDPDVTILDKNDLYHRVFRYKLFDAGSGAKVTRNSGFPIKLQDGQYAYVGYYGVWAPYGTEISDGDTITHAETGEEYTIFKVRGKLTEHTRTSIELGELDGVEISVWDDAVQEDYIIIWDSASAKFKQIGTRDQSSGQIAYEAEVDWIDYTFNNDWDGGWCESLRAWLPLGQTTPADSDIIYYHTEAAVNPNLITDLGLYYWGFALEAPITQAAINTAAADEQTYFSGPPTEKSYFFRANSMVLEDDDGDEVVLGASLDLENTFYEHGWHLGPLTTDPDYTDADCWDIYNEPSYYYWGTGPNEWNHYTSVIDGDGNFVVFQAPLRLSYTHLTANDINEASEYDGKKFNLEYDGFELHIPWEFDPDDGDEGEWEPVFNLKDGTVLQGDDATDYVVKGIEEALIMQEVSGADPAPELVIQEIDPPTLTYDAAKTALVGSVPANVELKVIKGEIIN